MKKLLIAIMLALVVAACGNRLPPDLSAEGTMAIRGTQVIEGMRAAVPSIKALVCPATTAPVVPNCISAQDADRVFAGMQEANDYAQKLAMALQAVDVAKDAASKEGARAQARTLIQSLQATLATIQVRPSNEGARVALVQLLGNITNLLLAIGF